jgi:hypothetical protein
MINETVSIRIHEHFGENLLTPEEGERLLGEIQPELANGKSVTLDFAGVRIVTSAFLNAAIGRLYGSFSHDVIRQHLSVENLSDIGRFTLKRVVENSKAYYESAEYRGAVDAASHPALEA